MKTSLMLAALAAIALSACSGQDEGGLHAASDTGFGNAVRTNIAVQTVNPNAPEDGATVSASGERAAIATDRYGKDKVKPPEDPATSQSSGGGGSGSGSSSASAGGSSGK